MEPMHYPSNITKSSEGEGHWVMFTSYPSLFAESSTEIQYSIFLPMSAQSLISTAEAVYAEQEGLGTVITDATRKMAAGITDFNESGGNWTDAAIGAFKAINLDMVTNKAAQSAEYIAAQSIRKSDLATRALAGANLAVNPKLSLLYQGPGKFRKFTFEFPMVAKSSSESGEIKKIIKAFRISTLPGYKQFTMSGSTDAAPGQGGSLTERKAGQNFFTFPSTWDIKFGHVDGIEATPFKIARSVCNSVSVNYAAAGAPFFFKGGEPYEVKMTCTFTETSIITKEAVEEGF